MRKLIVSEWITLDGVVQAPISPAEDADGGFEHAGWHLPHAGDPAAQRWTLDETHEGLLSGVGGDVGVARQANEIAIQRFMMILE